eukprot:CAMPEP_0181185184 /NCGR_PEP_ID=MMETSP1096-20121128/9369_1 /TAXON_ID=156174 ORGANISM="Chrysochromulina ericina, Strain CCMP281" /NCGR_SAMPLE_ID=MMETSP1096 /ASSEMBLY_ACC=CAM_ASM_000453 /LENGTH=122 /DNA_ID=CAMNT_0023274005 /DNA_START=654 /DNA_END=1022 /DNA_ORIENTATION=-
MMPPHDAASYLVLGRVVFREEEGSQPRLDLPQQEDGAAHARGPPDPAVEETKRAALRIERRECLHGAAVGHLLHVTLHASLDRVQWVAQRRSHNTSSHCAAKLTHRLAHAVLILELLTENGP